MPRTPLTKLRRSIYTRSGLKPARHTRRLLTVEQQPDLFPKTHRMKLLELKYRIKIEQVLFRGSLSDVAQLLNGDIDRSTVSRWKKYVRGQIGKVSYA